MKVQEAEHYTFSELLCSINKYKVQKDVGMAVPKTTETRCRVGSVQARQINEDYTSNPIPTLFLLQTAILIA